MASPSGPFIDRGFSHYTIFPAAAAEDMEGFAVALACRLACVPCTIVRGISNTVGDRDTTRWQTTAALEAAAGIVRRLLAEER